MRELPKDMNEAQVMRAFDLTSHALQGRRDFLMRCRATSTGKVCGATANSEPHPFQACISPEDPKCCAMMMATAFDINCCWVKGQDAGWRDKAR